MIFYKKIVIYVGLALCLAFCGKKNTDPYFSHAPSNGSQPSSHRSADVSRVCSAGIQHMRERGDANLNNLIRSKLPITFILRLGMDNIQSILENECY